MRRTHSASSAHASRTLSAETTEAFLRDPSNLAPVARARAEAGIEANEDDEDDEKEEDTKDWAAEDFCDKWDSSSFLEGLHRTCCRVNRYSEKLHKKVKLLLGFKDYMTQRLCGLSPWAYEDIELKKGLPFLTDFFQTPHIVVTLSNGIIQVNFLDHTKVVLSGDGRNVTFIDGGLVPRRLTMTVHQALTPEYFYDPEDQDDQDCLVQHELEDIVNFHRMYHVEGGRKDHGGMQEQEWPSEDAHQYGTVDRMGYIENRPAYNPERDHDLVLFPRPKLAARASALIRQRQSKFDGNGQMNMSLVMESDASTEDLQDIVKGDRRIRICQMTFLELHRQIVRRLRLTQLFLQERRMVLAKAHKTERVGRERFMKDQEDFRRRREEKKRREREMRGEE
ncbi:Cell cycle serine/threonine-protein kinase cdc5/MSD2 [Mortierella polycephala]|uniref:Cell cycle serine/threonine-protein kinase cdc5/MSD2 n=1 Tax=Mortierella polycephala TaxID=41804 RepID=A0A9P6TTJ8_9FUNG|nr:Cell cycle serine/threonine-protein kinase cdc5/MSD2 [Mortierella polycephala]